jgi:HK97 family phage portal protein
MRNSERVLTEIQTDEITDRIVSRIRRRQPLVYGSDWTYTPVQVAPAEAQFVGARKFQVAEIARIFGVPAELIGGDPTGSHTYTSVEQRSLEFLTYTLGPWLTRLETAIAELLPRNHYVRFNSGALLKASLRDRYEAHRVALKAGWMTVNEVRALEDLEPLPEAVPTPEPEAA